MTTRSDAVDVRRQAGWLPDDQDDLESWLAGHVSSCIIHSNIKPSYHVTKGEELGHFQYDGTHCVVFRPGAIAEFTLAAIPQPHDPKRAACGCPLEARHRQHDALRLGRRTNYVQTFR
jgi:hypothetical protein